MQTVPGLRLKFQRIVDQHEGDKRYRTLSSWTQLGAMIFGQLTGHWHVFLTNRFDLSSKTICDPYKARWQVWCAMIAYLLVAIIRFRNKLAWAIPSIFAVLGVSIFKNADMNSIWGLAPRERFINSGLQQLPLWGS